MLPPLPKLLDLKSSKDLMALAARVYEWGTGVQDLLRGMRRDILTLLSRTDDLEARPTTPDFGTPGTIEPDDAAAEGVAITAARSDHTHGITAAAAGTIEPDDAAAEGTASSFARSDHKHAISAAVAGAATPGDSAAEGTASSFARSDHKHSLAAFGTGAGTFCQGNDARLSDDRTASGLRSASTVVSVSAATAPASGQCLVATGSTAAIWRTPLTSGVWHPDVPPTSPHAKDDEFDGGSVSGNWTDWDPGAYMTSSIDTSASMLQLDATGNGSLRCFGLFKPVPASEFAFYTCAMVSGILGATGSMAGLAVFQDATNNPTTTDFRTLEWAATGTASAANNRTWTSYTTAGANTTRSMFTPLYLRMRCNGTTCASDISVDGKGWVQVSSVTLGFTPAEFGLVGFAFDNAIATKCFYRFFRVFSGAGSSAFDANGIGGFLGSFT